jgi:DNA end-binding protein Ku
MEDAGKVALGRLVMSQRERLVALEPRGDSIVATTLRTHEEVRDLRSLITDTPQVKPDADMIAIARRIIAQKEADFDPTQFEDRYEAALRELIERKQKGRPPLKVDAPQAPSNVINLMDALRASLAEPGAKRAPAKVAVRKAAPKKAPAKKAAAKKAKR